MPLSATAINWMFDSEDIELQCVSVLATKLMNGQTVALINQAIKLGYFDAPFAMHHRNLIRTLVYAYKEDNFTYEFIRSRLTKEENEVLDGALNKTPNVYAFNKYFNERLQAFALYKLTMKITELYEKSTRVDEPIPVDKLKVLISEYQNVLISSSSFEELAYINAKNAINVPDKEEVLQDIFYKTGMQFFPEKQPTLEKERKFRYPSTGLSLLDQMMSNHGLEPDRMVLYLGLPGHGKSIMLLQAALKNFASGLNVIFFSFENTIRETMQRVFAHVTRIDKNVIFGSRTNYEKAFDKVRDFFISNKGTLILQEYPSNSMTPVQVFDRVRQIEDSHGIKFDVVIIDYLDLLKSPARYNEYRHSLHAIYNQTKSLAKTYLTPVITASQLNRAAVREKKVDTDNVSESFAKIAVVDLAIIIRSNIHNQSNLVDMYIAKSRITMDKLNIRGYMRKEIFTFEEQEIVYENSEPSVVDTVRSSTGLDNMGVI